MEDVRTTGYKNKEVLSADDIVNTIIDISKLCQSYRVNRMFVSSSIWRKNNFQDNEVIIRILFN